MAEVIVSKERDIFNPNSMSFEERNSQIKAEKEREKEQSKKEKNSPFNSFIQINKKTYDLEDKLMKENPLAYRIWRFLVNNMDNYNAVMVSYSVMIDIFEVGRTTIYRAIKTLNDGNYINIYKSGTSNVYAINDNMVWASWGNNKQYSKFQANVIISEAEQTDDIKKQIAIQKHKKLTLKDDNNDK